MEGYKHFSHPHTLCFQQSLEGAQLTCTGCNFPCTDTPVYACHSCEFFLHDQCFNATRSLNHPSHPDHPLSLFPSPTHTSGSFVCNSCNETGSGFCFACPTCKFDLHIHCAYNNLKYPNPFWNPPNQIKLKSHPHHPLKYLPEPPYYSTISSSCNVCGSSCDPNGALYRCDTCDYDVHVGCISLPETVRRVDHAHTLSLLHVNPYSAFECDVCRRAIAQINCMYFCTYGCDYGMHVKCVSGRVLEKPSMGEKLLNTMLSNSWTLAIIMVTVAILIFTIKTKLLDTSLNDPNPGYIITWYRSVYCYNNHCVYTYNQVDDRL